MFPGCERSRNLCGMQLVAGGDYNRIHIWVVENLRFFRRAITKSELLRGMAGVRAVGGAYSD